MDPLEVNVAAGIDECFYNFHMSGRDGYVQTDLHFRIIRNV